MIPYALIIALCICSKSYTSASSNSTAPENSSAPREASRFSVTDEEKELMGYTPLHVFVIEDKVDEIRKLFPMIRDEAINATNNPLPKKNNRQLDSTIEKELELYKVTPLHIALLYGRMEVADLLIKHGADLNSDFNKYYRSKDITVVLRTKYLASTLFPAIPSGNERQKKTFPQFLADVRNAHSESLEHFFEEQRDMAEQDTMNFLAGNRFNNLVREKICSYSRRLMRSLMFSIVGHYFQGERVTDSSHEIDFITNYLNNDLQNEIFETLKTMARFYHKSVPHINFEDWEKELQRYAQTLTQEIVDFYKQPLV